MLILSLSAYLLMAWVVWFYALIPLAELFENAVWQWAKPQLKANAAAPVVQSRAAVAEKPIPSGGSRQTLPGLVLQHRAA